MARTEASAAVPAAPRPGSGAMFDGIAGRYDPINRLMTFGLDRSWRVKTVKALELPRAARVLDLATGTAEVAMLVARRHPDAQVIGLDPSARMLEVGKSKVFARGLGGRVELELGQAEKLPYEDASFDGVTIAFGIRNVEDRPASLREIARVLKPGGRLAILEANEPTGLLAPFTRLHCRVVVPLLGRLLSSAKEYRYLQTSMEAFPAPRDFAATLAGCGLEVLRLTSLGFGTCTLYVAQPAVAQPAVAQPAVAQPAVAQPAVGTPAKGQP